MLMLSLLATMLPTQCAQTGEEMDHAAHLYATAQEIIAQGDAKEGVAKLRKLLKAAPWLTQARWALGRAEHDRGAYVQAYVELKRFLIEATEVEDKQDARRRLRDLEAKVAALRKYADAERAAAAQDWATAASSAEQLIVDRPNFSLPYRLLGIAFTSMGRYPQAAETFARYLEVEPEAAERYEIEERLADYKSAK